MFGIWPHGKDGGKKAQKGRLGHSVSRMKQEDSHRRFMWATEGINGRKLTCSQIFNSLVGQCYFFHSHLLQEVSFSPSQAWRAWLCSIFLFACFSLQCRKGVGWVTAVVHACVNTRVRIFPTLVMSLFPAVGPAKWSINSHPMGNSLCLLIAQLMSGMWLLRSKWQFDTTWRDPVWLGALACPNQEPALSARLSSGTLCGFTWSSMKVSLQKWSRSRQSWYPPNLFIQLPGFHKY